MDLEAFLRDAQQRAARFEGAQQRAGELVGRAATAGEQIVVECTMAGIRRLVIDPRAKRMSVEEMSAAILQAIHAADADLKRQLEVVMTDAFGEVAPSREPQAATARIEEAQQAYDRMMEDAMGEMDRLRRKLGY
ncbi:hypothetical protein ACTMTI_46890 [Nonomuraea sp. H19]|uniref:hypothetical protein n=1 Tax=Nonomuraea sp. H19 TaxID=3452206 RepID=UPI003F8C2B59